MLCSSCRTHSICEILHQFNSCLLNEAFVAIKKSLIQSSLWLTFCKPLLSFAIFRESTQESRCRFKHWFSVQYSSVQLKLYNCICINFSSSIVNFCLIIRP